MYEKQEKNKVKWIWKNLVEHVVSVCMCFFHIPLILGWKTDSRSVAKSNTNVADDNLIMSKQSGAF